MSALLPLLAQCAVLLVCGSTVLLALGCGAVLLCKSPVHRQRISELTIAGVLVWMVLALFPLPRLLPDRWDAKGQTAEVQHSLELTPAPIDEVASPPAVTEWVPEVGIADDENNLPLGVPSPTLLETETHELGSPSYVENETSTLLHERSLNPSPSEETPSLSSQSISPANGSEATTTIAPVWQFDSQKLVGLFTGLYLAGASLCLFWILAGYVLLLRIRQTAAAPPEWLAKQYQELSQQAGIAPPRLIVSRLCGRPLTWGMLWPVIVLPHSLCRQENKSQLGTILLHELGHIAQQDAQGNFLFCLALPLLYAHPLYWWLRRESQLAAELVADDWAAWQAGKETYIEELVALARCTGTSSLPLVGVTGLFSSPSQFYRRMSMLLAREKRLSTKTSLPWRLASLSALAGSVALAASLAGVRPAEGQTAPPSATPAATPPAAVPLTDPNVVAPTPPRADNAADPNAKAPAVVPAGTSDAAPKTPPAIVPDASPMAVPPPLALTPSSAPKTDEDAEAVILREIKNLQDQLQALEAKRGAGNKTTAGIKDVTIQPGAHQIKIVRADDKGRIWVETWTTDQQGRPAKILERSASENRDPSAIGFTADGKKITRVVVHPDGSRSEQILDAATGKVIAENVVGAEPRPGKTRPADDVVPPDTKPGKPIVSPRVPAVEYPIPVLPGAKYTPTAPRIAPSGVVELPVAGYPMAQPAGGPGFAKGSQQLDLVSLATSYADAVSARETAAAKLADTARLNDSNVVSQQEVTAAKLALSAADRKEQLLRKIAEVALEGTAQEVEIATALHQSGNATASAAGEAKMRLAILKQILGTTKPSTDNGPKKP